MSRSLFRLGLDQVCTLVIASEARQSRVGYAALDCFVTTLLVGDDSTWSNVGPQYVFAI